MTKNKFTLIELLIVLAIITILLSILLPSLGNARRSAENTVCKSNLAQISRGATLFAKQNDYQFWERRKDIKGTHIGREYNNGEHEFNLYNAECTKQHTNQQVILYTSWTSMDITN